jgi:hypothetical protein
MGASVIRLRLGTGCSANSRRSASATKSRSVEPRCTAAILARFMRSSGRSKVVRINMLICFPAGKFNCDPRAKTVRYRILARALNLGLFLPAFGFAPDCNAYPHGYPQEGNGGIARKIKVPKPNLQVVDCEGLLLTGGADGTRTRPNPNEFNNLLNLEGSDSPADPYHPRFLHRILHQLDRKAA